MEGVMELAEFVFDLPVKRAYPKDLLGFSDIVSSPVYSTAVGLVLWAATDRHAISRMAIGNSETLKKVRQGVSQWIKDMF